MAISPIPGMPGESIDARILPDVLELIQRFKVKVTDGFAPTGHAADGDHPKGLAVDLVPDTARGGSWQDVNAAAKFAAEHKETFRWVGYDGRFGTTAAPGHGEGNHLHLSWHGGGTAGDKLPIHLFSAGGGGIGAGVVLGPVAAAADALGDKVPDAAADLATGVAGALIGKAVDALGLNGARVAVAIALTVAGVVLIGVGAARMLGLGERLRTAGALGAKVASRGAL